MSTLGKFLLGGIQFRKNFIGQQTLKSASYTVIECSLRVAPLIILVKAARLQRKPDFSVAEEGADKAEVRLSSLSDWNEAPLAYECVISLSR